MRAREKLTVEEKVSIALDLIKRDRSLEEIQEYYRVSHTTAYKIRNAFIDGGRRALGGVDNEGADLEARVRALEERLDASSSRRRGGNRKGPRASKPRSGGLGSRVR